MYPRPALRALRPPPWALALALIGACSVDTTPPADGGLTDGATGSSTGSAQGQPSGGGGRDGSVGGQGKDAAPVELPKGDITYYQHVKPLLDAKCVRCHVEGTVAPFALDTYELAQRFAEFARRAIDQGTMPPWLFDGECNDYRGDLSLSEAEKQLFGAWVDQGKLEGDPGKPGATLEVDDLRLSRTDVTLMMPEAFTQNTSDTQPDEYRCFPVAWPAEITTPKFVTGFRALPGNAKVVHHVEVYRVSAAEAQAAFAKDEADPGLGYECFAGPGLGQGTIGGWAPGSEGYDYPEGVGIPVEPGSVFVIQVHYNTAANGGPAPDRSGVAFKVDDQAITGGYNFWTNPIWTTFRGTMSIPAGNADVPVTWNADPTVLGGSRAIEIHMAALHMHNLGKSGFMYLRKANGERKCIIEIPRWDFHWQAGARLRVPVEVQPGDTLEMECRFDNSAAHQAVINGVQQAPRNVTWGENTSDEMCLGILLWSPLMK